MFLCKLCSDVIESALKHVMRLYWTAEVSLTLPAMVCNALRVMFAQGMIRVACLMEAHASHHLKWMTSTHNL